MIPRKRRPINRDCVLRVVIDVHFGYLATLELTVVLVPVELNIFDLISDPLPKAVELDLFFLGLRK